MACKFHAAMNPFHRPTVFRVLLLAALAGAGVGPAVAEKADRNKPLTIEADKPGTLDLANQVIVFNGNVVIEQGTMMIRAERAEVRQSPDGSRAATAIGTPGRPASFRQKREGLDETIEGSADRIEYDGRGDVLRFVGHASVRRLRGGAPADEITGNLITYNNQAELFSVEGGGANGSGRVRAVLTPPESAASAPRSQR
jgi:lipopolysaccharide export system protein LptA